MNTRHLIIIAGVLLWIAMLAAGCSKNDAGTSPNNQGTATFDQVINSGGDFTPVSTDTTVVEEETTTETVGNEQYFCTRKTYSVTEAPAEFPQYDPNAEVIFAGNLLQGASLGQATPDPIPVQRAGGRIVMVILNGSDSTFRDIPEVSLSEVVQAQNEIIAGAANTIPARFSFSMEEVNSHEQLALALDLNVGYLSGDLSASLSFSSDREYNRFVVKLRQSYFTMAFQLPTSKSEIFGPGVTPEDLAPYIHEGNPGAFISSVTYGRVFYLLVESTESREEMQASLDASFSAAVSSGSLGTDVKYVADLSNLRIKAFAMGGSDDDAINAITTDFDQLKTFLAQGADLDNGVPLSYVVRSLSNPSKIVKVKVASEYDVTDCISVSESIGSPIAWYRVDDPRFYATGSNPGLVTKLVNVFGDSSMNALPPSKTYGCELVAGQLNGGSLPAMRFRSGVTGVDGMFQYPGNRFVNTDYTVFVVARLQTTAINYPAYVMWGSSGQPFQNLSLGYRDNTRMTMTHENYRLDVNTAADLTGYNVYTFRFSKTEGMSIFVNGLQVAAGIDATKTEPLTSYLGARIGSSNGSTIYIAELRAHAIAVNDDQRNAVVDELLTKYAL